MSDVRSETIGICWREHTATGLLAAFSNDLAGLLVVGHSIDEIKEKLPGAIKQIYGARGLHVISVEIGQNTGPEEFFPPAFTVSANLKEAA